MIERTLLLVLLVGGCGGPAVVDVDKDQMRAIASAAFAVAVLQPDDGDVAPTPTPTPKPDNDCDCEGKGFIVHGDGHKTPCPCDNCQCGNGDAEQVEEPPVTEEPDTQVEAVVPQSRQVEYWGASWCGPCQQVKTQLAGLKRNGWRVGPEENAHVRVRDYDEHEQEARQKNVVSLPTFIVYRDGVEVERHVGFRDAFQIGEMYTK